MLRHSEHTSGSLRPESFFEPVGQSLVRFSVKLKPYFWGFVWGTVFGSVISFKPQTTEEKMYEQASTRAMQILNRESREAVRGDKNLKAYGLFGNGRH